MRLRPGFRRRSPPLLSSTDALVLSFTWALCSTIKCYDDYPLVSFFYFLDFPLSSFIITMILLVEKESNGAHNVSSSSSSGTSA